MHLVTSRIIPLFCYKSCDPFLRGAMRQTHTTIRLDGRTADEPLCSNAVFAVFSCVARRFLALHGGFLADSCAAEVYGRVCDRSFDVFCSPQRV